MWFQLMSVQPWSVIDISWTLKFAQYLYLKSSMSILIHVAYLGLEVLFTVLFDLLCLNSVSPFLNHYWTCSKPFVMKDKICAKIIETKHVSPWKRIFLMRDNEKVHGEYWSQHPCIFICLWDNGSCICHGKLSRKNIWVGWGKLRQRCWGNLKIFQDTVFSTVRGPIFLKFCTVVLQSIT